MSVATMPPREELPVDAYLPQIVQLVRDNPAVVVQADPGAGKSTRIPQALMEAFQDRKIKMTLPRRAAVAPICERICAEVGEAPGSRIGWTLRGELSPATDDTQFVVSLTQSLVNWITRKRCLPDAILVIDEAHERSIETDTLLAVVKQYLPSFPNARVIITSATIDTEKFCRYFGRTDDQGVFRPAPSISVEGKCHDVERRPYQLSKGEHHNDGAGSAAIEELIAFADEGKISVAGGYATGGTIGVLQSGLDDIRRTVSRLKKAASSYPDISVEILSLWGQSDDADRRKVFAPLEPNTLRFVVSTEVLRSSVTLPSCIGMIDALQVKRRISDQNGVGHMKKISVSRAEAVQAMGRAGRTAPGFYRPVVFEDEYNRLRAHPTPAIAQEPIMSVVLQIAACGLDIRTLDFIENPEPQKLANAVARLQRLGLLDESAKITNKGKEIVRLPVDPDKGVALLTARERNMLPEAIIVVGVLEQGGVFDIDSGAETLTVRPHALQQIMARMEWLEPESKDKVMGRWVPSKKEPRDATKIKINPGNLPRWIKKKELKSSRYSGLMPILWEVDCTGVDFPEARRAEWLASLARTRWAGDTKSDFVAVVHAWREFMEMRYQLHPSDLRDLCRGNGVNFRRMQLATDVMRHLCQDLGVDWSQLTIKAQKFDSGDLTKVLLTGLSDNLGVNFTDPKARNPRYNSRLDPFTLLYQSAAHGHMPLVLAGGVRRTRAGDQIADLAAPVEYEWIAEMLPDLCEFVRSENRVETYFNGLLIDTEEVSPTHSLRPRYAASASTAPVDGISWDDVPAATAVRPAPAPQPAPVTVPAPAPAAPTPPPAAPQFDPLKVRLLIGKQRTLAEDIAGYQEEAEALPAGDKAEELAKMRLLAAMRACSTAPTSVDEVWTQKAEQLLGYCQTLFTSSTSNDEPKKGKKGSKKGKKKKA